jgi:type IV pilus assembly protein PilO
MAIIPQERPQQIALVVIILALAGLYAFHTYWYSPRIAEVESLQTQLTNLEDQNRRAQIVAARGGPELEERVALYERHVRRLEELIPAGEEVPALLNAIAMEAIRTQVILATWRPEASLAGEFYTRESYQMAVIGEYHNVARFLTGIASLPRIITPLDVELEPFQGSLPREDIVAPVQARFRIQTYILPGTTVPAEIPLPEGVNE